MNHEGIKTPTSDDEARADLIAREVVDAAFRIHTALGPGLLESVYEACMAIELRKRGLSFATQVALPVTYEGETIEPAFRIDLLVDSKVIVELKAVEKLLPIHEAQLLTYLKLSGCRLGLLLNFNAVLIKQGIKRMKL
ncbi:MAG: GxxExxY protein [Burkholderiales bacterium]